MNRATSKKRAFFIVTAVKSSNPTQKKRDLRTIERKKQKEEWNNGKNKRI
jgi:hypothetical protein